MLRRNWRVCPIYTTVVFELAFIKRRLKKFCISHPGQDKKMKVPIITPELSFELTKKDAPENFEGKRKASDITDFSENFEDGENTSSKIRPRII